MRIEPDHLPRKQSLTATGVLQVHIGAGGWNGVLEDRPLAFEDYDFPPIPGLDALIAPLFKPQGTGFWTSTTAGADSGAWSRAGAFAGRRTPDATEFLYRVVGGPRMVAFSGNEDILRLARELGIATSAPLTASDIAPFWCAVAGRFDAVHVPANHQRRGLLMTWDVESTLWFRPHQHLRLVGRRPLGSGENVAE